MLEETMTITKKRYGELIKIEDTFLALQAAGVDNWDGWDHAMEILEEMEGE